MVFSCKLAFLHFLKNAYLAISHDEVYEGVMGNLSLVTNILGFIPSPTAVRFRHR